VIGIDSQHRTREVHSWVATGDERRLRALRGDHKTKPQDRWRETTVEAPRRGGPKYINKRTVLNVFTPHFKEAIHEKFLMPRGAPGAFHFYDGIVATSSDYLKQLVNERPIDEIDKRTGRRKTTWRPRFAQWGNHMGDCEVYAMAAAEVLLAELNCDWDASRWKKGRPKRAPRQEQQQTVAVREDQI
jgi:phage terminase large subunit GpA-like protein